MYYAILHTFSIRAALEMKVEMTKNKYSVIKVIHMTEMYQYVFMCVKDGIVEFHYLYCADLLEAVKKHEMIYGFEYHVRNVEVQEGKSPDRFQSKIEDYIIS